MRLDGPRRMSGGEPICACDDTDATIYNTLLTVALAQDWA